MKQQRVKIISNRQIAHNTSLLEFNSDTMVTAPLPGQFLTIRVSDSTVPLLRRPFAYSGYNPINGSTSIIYEKRGVATEILSAKQTGNGLDIIGPLGNTFELPTEKSFVTIVAGGIGLGPMLFAAKNLVKHNCSCKLVFGCRSSNQIPDTSLFAKIDTQFCTDDGSRGFHGTVVDYLKNTSNNTASEMIIWACGPTPMLKSINNHAIKNNISCFVSMEQVMACGVGACMGCTVKVKSGAKYARVCKEGPIFNSREIVWI